ncbi:hypothetical protein OTB20_04035 [Streptomyces sp. H27-H1]|uniref:hypothetical protein n=1 Tax=Streptomyces sp. H27-H1 TaxID=2996461 RepID=UPI0022704F3B|nr:hypothetical protein [Streptomyces sp. H27-H1]MCY0925385.1 hypothetical protein [Streptomyces sp. H27-H1]
MEEQGGSGGAPLEGERKRDGRRKAHGDRQDDRKKTAAADTDEASRLDRPQQPEKPDGKGARWVSPREE